MKPEIFLLAFGLVVLHVEAQLFKPRPNLIPITRKPIVNPYASNFANRNIGRYTDGGDGQYRPDNSGAYNNDDGRYHPDESGQYVHNDQGYKHVEGGQGPGGPGGPGADPYRHQEDRYKDKDEQYKYKDGQDKDAQYKDGDAGKYVHKDDPYKHVSGPDGGKGPGPDKYKHEEPPQVPYKHVQEPPVPYVHEQPKYEPEIYGQKPKGRAILHKCKELDPEGYEYNYDTDKVAINGAEDGALQYRGTDKEAMCAVGYYNYVGDDNKEVTTYYIADEYGFRPVGEHLHPQIVRMLKYFEQHFDE